MGTTLKSTLDHYIYIKGDLMIMCARYDLQWDKEARMSQIMHQRNCVGKTNYIHLNIYITIPWTRMHPQLPHFSAFIRIRGLWYVQVPFLQKKTSCSLRTLRLLVTVASSGTCHITDCITTCTAPAVFWQCGVPVNDETISACCGWFPAISIGLK